MRARASGRDGRPSRCCQRIPLTLAWKCCSLANAVPPKDSSMSCQVFPELALSETTKRGPSQNGWRAWTASICARRSYQVDEAPRSLKMSAWMYVGTSPTLSGMGRCRKCSVLRSAATAALVSGSCAAVESGIVCILVTHQSTHPKVRNYSR